MFCPFCGKSMIENGKFCSSCGKEMHQPNHTPTSKYVRRSTLLITIALATIVAIAIVGIIVVKVALPEYHDYTVRTNVTQGITLPVVLGNLQFSGSSVL